MKYQSLGIEDEILFENIITYFDAGQFKNAYKECLDTRRTFVEVPKKYNLGEISSGRSLLDQQLLCFVLKDFLAIEELSSRPFPSARTKTVSSKAMRKMSQHKLYTSVKSFFKQRYFSREN